MTKDYTRKKPIISGTVSPQHKRKIDKLIEEGEFASVSDFISQAVSDLLSKYDEKFTGTLSQFTNDEIEILKNILRERADEIDFEKKKKKQA
jgi:Predicted transcriptional regulators containing the CopG/Arc/MetJ DNA-binding domain